MDWFEVLAMGAISWISLQFIAHGLGCLSIGAVTTGIVSLVFGGLCALLVIAVVWGSWGK